VSDVEPVLAACSDLLVLKALERAATFGARARRRAVPPHSRHRAYQDNPVPVEKIEHIVKDMFVLCPLLAARHHLEVDTAAWGALLEQYTRVLLMMGQPHSPARLIDVLGKLPPVEDWDA
jgi:protein-L-isoaspartate O-methyltransferase